MSLGIPFGKYRLTRRLARGGMAEVFLATQKGPEGFERTVALKRILPHLADIPQFTQMFMDEARLAAQISHPNIAHIYEFGEAEGTYFIAMEYINGVDLSVVVMGGAIKPLPLEHAARVVADVCAALHYAHNLESGEGKPLGLVHRDISPQNVLVSFDGAVKILDFGIAKVVDHVERTQPGIVRGKFSYMSPEQVEGKRLDRRSDLFSAGIVLYELCTGSSLFPRTDAVQAMYAIRKAQVPTPARDGEPLPERLVQIIDKALAQRREDRYGAAAEMQLDLEEYLRSASRMSNSVLLGEYFKEHYKSSRPEGARLDAPRGTADAPAGTARVEDPHKLLGTALAGDVQQLRPEDLEPLTPAPHDGPTEVSGHIIQHTPDSLAREPTEALESAQILSIHTDPEQAVSDEDATVPQGARPAPAAEEPTATRDLHAARTSQQEVPEATPAPPPPPPSRVSRALLAVLAVGVVVAGVLVGYLLSVPGGRPARDTSGDEAAAKRPTVSKAEPDQAAPRASRLVITSSPPGASVKVDGTTLSGITPVEKRLRPGTHTILASMPGYEDRAHVVQLEPGKVFRVSLVLRRRAGQGEVVALRRPDPEPEPEPEVDPPPARSTRKKRRPRRQKLARRPDARAAPSPAPAPRPRRTRYGQINVTTIPWTKVFLGSRQLGITPLARVRLPAGTHRLRFENPNGINATRSVTVKPGSVTKVRLRF